MLSEPFQDCIGKTLLTLKVNKIQKWLGKNEELFEALRSQLFHQLLEIVKVV